MTWFFEFLFRFPTAVNTVLAGIVLLYWALEQVGVLKISLEKIVSPNETIGSILTFFGINQLPLETVFSLLVLSSWVMTGIMTQVILVSSSIAGTTLGYILGVVILLLSMLLSLTLLRFWYKPAENKPVVPIKSSKKPIFVGKICRVTSAAVDERFGEAEFDDDGKLSQLHVRCQAPSRIRRDESALIIEYDKDKNVYWVEPYSDPLV